MPVYEYRCDACNIRFELRQKFSDPPADKCPKCGGVVRKLVSAASFSLKGAGWYGDGYGAKAESAKSEGDTALGTEAGTAEAGVTTERASTDTAQTSTETTVSPTSQVETKSATVEAPTPTKDKTEVKSSTSDAVS